MGESSGHRRVEEKDGAAQQRHAHDLPVGEQLIEFVGFETLDAALQSEEGGFRVL